MGEFHGLDGLEDAGIVKGPQEKATEKFINRFREGKADNAMADFLYSSMLSIARNIDAQNNRGREISRNICDLPARLHPTARNHLPVHTFPD